MKNLFSLFVLLFICQYSLAQKNTNGAGLEPDSAPAPMVPPSGTQFFRALFDYAGFTSQTNTDPFVEGLDKRVVVVYGFVRDPFQFQEVSNLTRNVLNSGGAVLFATDKGCNFINYLPVIGTHGDVSGYDVTVKDPKEGYNGKASCPFATIGEHANDITPQINPFAGVTKIATNKPSIFFDRKGSRPVTMARFANPINVTANGRVLNSPQTSDVFAVGEILPERLRGSRWIALADESALANDLFAAPGTENFLFALHLVGWLQQGPKGPRTEVTFIEYGQVVERLDEVKFVTTPQMPLPPLPGIPTQAEIVTFIDDSIAQAQDKDAFHNLLVGENQQRSPYVLRVVIAVIGIVAFWYLLRRAFGSKQPTSEPIGDPEFSGAAGGTLLAALKREVVRSNEFTDAVVEYIKDTFQVAGMPPGFSQPELPPVVVTGLKVNKKTLRKELKQLWELAYGTQREPVHYAVWKQLEPTIDRVRRLAEKGRWHFEIPGGSA